MAFLKVLSKRKKIGLISIALLAILLASGALASTVGTFGETSGVLASSTNIPSTTNNLPAAAPSYVGKADKFLSGPTLVPSAFGSPPTAILAGPNGGSNSVDNVPPRSLPAPNDSISISGSWHLA